jgi:catechol 2,3-dioxygenase-like lactoylglutathione lyase family enzyme
MSLQDSKIATRLPATDLDRARAFYSEKLGLDPVDERPGGLLYRVGGSEFALFESAGRASGDHTQMAFEVSDLDATIAALEARGIVFEDYGIVDVEGNYPSKNSSGERAVWVRDSEGNLLGIGQPVR